MLANELQQTGLPKEHTQVLCRVYSDKVSALTAQLHKQSLRTSYPVDIKARQHDNHYDIQITFWRAETESEETKTFVTSRNQLIILLHGKERLTFKSIARI